VVSLGGWIAAELTIELLEQQGAVITRVVRPGVDPGRSPGRGVALDLRTEDGVSAAREMLSRADVGIENFRPGVVERLGLGANESRAVNPGLIYCSLPGFSR